MSFKETFEHNLNTNMQGDGHPGPAPTVVEDVDLDIKKSAFPPPQEEFNDSKEQPPRFSTLFGVAPAPKLSSPPTPPGLPTPSPQAPTPPPTQAYEYHREYYGPPSRARRTGVTIPMPLFIVLTILFTLMSIILSAYTIIGLYSNAPSRVFPWAGPGTVSTVCSPGEQQPSINFAPNFVMSPADKVGQTASVVTVTISATPSTVTGSGAVDSTSSSTTSSTSFSTGASAAASGISGALAGLGASASGSSASTALVTVGPTPSTVTSVQLVTKDPSGKVISNSMVTLTSTTVVGASSTTGSITSRGESSTLATVTSAPLPSVTTGWSAVSSALESADGSSAVASASGS